jgi:NACalpha-BTF3-like transcription factor
LEEKDEEDIHMVVEKLEVAYELVMEVALLEEKKGENVRAVVMAYALV